MSNHKKKQIIFLLSTSPQHINFFREELKEEFLIFEYRSATALNDAIKKTLFDILIVDDTESLKVLDLCKTLKMHFDLRLLPILLITDNPSQDYERLAIHSGITEFIHLPLNAATIQKKIQGAVRSQKVQEKMLGLSSTIHEDKRVISKSRRYNFLLSESAFEEVIAAKQSGKPLALVLLKINNLDEYTVPKHLIEDFFVNLLKQHLRANDLLFPQGNGVFFIMFPTTSKRAATLITESIENHAKQTPLLYGGKSTILSISIGLAAFEVTENDPRNPYEHFESLLKDVQKAIKPRS